MLIREPALWREPVRGGFIDPSGLDLDGLEQLRSYRVAPPMSRLTGTTLEAVGPSSATFALPVTPWLTWSHGYIPGGVLALPGDGAMGCALQTALPARTQYTTAEMSMTYVRPAVIGSRLAVHGRCVHAGRTLGLTTAEVVDEKGRLLAAATSRCHIFRAATGRPPRGGTAVALQQAAAGALSTSADGPDPHLRPVAGAYIEPAEWQRHSGREILQAQIDGTLPLPPLHHLLGIAPTEAGDGTAACSMPLSGWLATPYGWPQGGFIFLIADMALGLAAQTIQPAARAMASVDVKVNFLRPVACDGSLLTARASVVHRGRTLAVCSAEVTAADGKRVAMATGSSALLPPSTSLERAETG